MATGSQNRRMYSPPGVCGPTWVSSPSSGGRVATAWPRYGPVALLSCFTVATPSSACQHDSKTRAGRCAGAPPRSPAGGAAARSTAYVEISRARGRAELVTDDAADLRAQLDAVTGERIAALEAIGGMPRDGAGKDAGTGPGEERGRDAEPDKAGERQPRAAPPGEREIADRAAQAERDGVGRPGYGGDARPARERGAPASRSKPREAPVREPGKGKGVDLGL